MLRLQVDFDVTEQFFVTFVAQVIATSVKQNDEL